MTTLSLFGQPSAPPEPRAYQQRAIVALREHALAGRRRVLLSLPTGSGKTVLAAAIIHSARTNFDARVLFVVHRIELIDQAVRQLARVGISHVGVIRADDERTDATAPVQVASIQTLARRKLPEADVVFIDEAHRSLADSYQRVFAGYPEAVILGLTATPCRSDGRGLGEVWHALEQAATYSQLIADKFIAEPTVYSTPRPPDLSGVRTVAGEYDLGQLELAMLDGSLVGDLVSTWTKLAENRRTVVFATGVDHSKAIVARFQAAGVAASHVDGTTPEDERRSVGERLRSGDLRIVSNVGVYTEGWDEPSVRCLILARPTKSLALYMQMAGRVLRQHDSGKPIILDHAGNVDRHGLPHEDRDWTLAEGAKKKPQQTAKMCKGCYAYVPRASKVCPLCGFEFPIAEERKKPEELGGVELVERAHVDEKRRFYDQQVEKARSRGFKPGFAAAQFKEKFGAWPPWAWSTATKAAFALDADWQGRQAHREAERRHWQEVEAQRMAKLAAFDKPAEVEAEAEEAPQEESFGTWLEAQDIPY